MTKTPGCGRDWLLPTAFKEIKT